MSASEALFDGQPVAHIVAFRDRQWDAHRRRQALEALRRRGIIRW